MKGNWKAIEKHISDVTKTNIHFIQKSALSGGCINQSWKVTDSNHKHWFIKINTVDLLTMFIAESEGLDEISKTNSIRTPESICYGSTDEFSYFILEFLELSPLSHSSLSNQGQAGEQLANMHLDHSKNSSKNNSKNSSNNNATSFGWHRNNTIGSTPQINQQNNNWVTFWKENRLIYQLELSHKNGFTTKSYEKGLALADNIQHFFSAYTVKPSLLHGDLWGGNISADNHGNPVIYDPAVYYGDREADIAMTELFGGFNQEFYSAYNAHYALDEGYKTRKTLYNLYHILNHFNLFGSGYASQSEQMINKLLAEVR